MSRVGKKPISIPEGVEVKIAGDAVKIKGPKGELTQVLHSAVILNQEDGEMTVSVHNPENVKERALWGLFRKLLSNMVEGVTKGFEKKLEINGVGYRAETQDKKLILNVGYSHSVEFNFPEGTNMEVAKNVITVSGIDKQLVGETAARIRRIRKPEPYQGKGIKYVDEKLRRKAGKAAKAVGG